MKITTLEDGREVFAGLTWDVSPQGFGNAEAQFIAKGQKASAYLLRAEARNLALSFEADPTPKAVTLAGTLADRLGPNFCGVFPVANQYAFIAVSNGCVLADGDRIYDSAVEAKARLSQEIGLFEAIWAPADWDVDDTRDSATTVSELDWNLAAPLLPLSNRSRGDRRKLLGGLLLVAICFAAYEGYGVWEARRQAEEAAKAPPPPPPDPWVNAPRPEEVAAACLAARETLADASHQGWELSGLTCDVAQHAATATLTPYTTQAVLPALPAPYTAKLSPDGNTMTVSAPLTIPMAGPAKGRNDEQPSAAATLALHNFLVALAVTGKAPAWQGTERSAHFDVSTQIPLQDVAPSLMAFPTLVLSRLDYAGTGDWRIQGDIYL